MSRMYYYEHAGELNRELVRTISKPVLKALHEKRPWRHFLIVLRQFALLLGLPVLIYYFESPLVWVPAAILQGFVIFGFTVLLHEAVHKCIFKRDRPRVNGLLEFLYASASGLSAAQFHRWHMDHHNQLGTNDADPKRAHLSPKRNARWLKLLYCTPALFPIYFRAAAKAQSGYSAELRRRIKRERFFVTAMHLTVLGCFLWLDPWFAVKAYVIPVFFVFPVAFTVNRLGQHYLIDPDKIANWSTLMRSNWAWNFLFLYSTYHLEHHYFPAVPFYNLKRLQRELSPFFEKHQIPFVTYRRLLYTWFWKNHFPHSKPSVI